MRYEWKSSTSAMRSMCKARCFIPILIPRDMKRVAQSYRQGILCSWITRNTAGLFLQPHTICTYTFTLHCPPWTSARNLMKVYTSSCCRIIIDFRYQNPNRYYAPQDLFLGANLPLVTGHTLVVTEMDRSSLALCEEFPREFPLMDCERVLGKVATRARQMNLNLRR